jgi:hypothetical protein
MGVTVIPEPLKAARSADVIRCLPYMAPQKESPLRGKSPGLVPTFIET